MDRRQLTSRALRSAIQIVADRGFVVRRHPVVRLQTQLTAHDVDLVFDVGAAKGTYGTETVRVTRLDDLVEELPVRGKRIFLKVDTQGFERQVLDGAARTLAQCVGVQLELSFTTTYEGGMLVDEAISRMYDAGFVLTGLEPGFAAASGAVLQADGTFFRES
jgi:hypothetical protein